VQKFVRKHFGLNEVSLNRSQAVDAPVLPGSRGLGPFLSGISDDLFLEHRRRLRDVTLDDLVRVSDRYLARRGDAGIAVIGPESTSSKLDSSWTVEPLVIG
jgi:Zn-dependent M16 (insulinase) family peptidase